MDNVKHRSKVGGEFVFGVSHASIVNESGAPEQVTVRNRVSSLLAQLYICH
jgi:hypothetical protein